MARSSSANTAGILFILAFMTLAGLAMLLGVGLPQFLGARSLVNDSQVASARIMGVYDHAQNQGRYANYSFRVKGSTYTGTADYSGSYGDKGPIEIRYLASNPKVSAISPEAKYKNSIFGLAFLSFWVAAVVGMATLALRTIKKQRLSDSLRTF